MTGSEQRVSELDGVRGLACLQVLVLHYVIVVSHPASGTALYKVHKALYLSCLGGVDLFFVLSGFLIGGILMDHRGAKGYYRVFWTRRAARILPVYIMLFASFYLALALRPQGAWPWADEWLMRPALPFWSYATFTQNFVMAAANDSGPFWVGITWSLSIEEQFYWLLPLIVAFMPRRFIVALAISCIVAAPIIRTIFFHEWGLWAAYGLLPARMENLMCGVLVACLIRNQRALQVAIRFRRIVDAILVGLVVIIAAQITFKLAATVGPTFPLLKEGLEWFQWTVYSFVFALGLLRVFLHKGGLFNAILKSRAMTGLGLISYAVYMFHQSVNGLLQGIFLGQQPDLSTWADARVTALSACVVLAVATASYKFVEMPIRTWAKRATYGERAPSPHPQGAKEKVAS